MPKYCPRHSRADVLWMMGEMSRLMATGLSNHDAARSVLPEFRTRSKRALTLAALRQLYYSSLKRREALAELEPRIIVAVNKKTAQSEIFASMDEVQSKLGVLSSGFDFYRAEKLNVKVVTRIVVE